MIQPSNIRRKPNRIVSHYPLLDFYSSARNSNTNFRRSAKIRIQIPRCIQVGMLENYLKLPDPSLGKTLKLFTTALKTGRFSIKRNLSLVFLCGANKSPLIPSERRNFLKVAIERALPHIRIVYAEKVMEELANHGKTKNLLDIEHQISSLADWILIVLESYSSFCELGAFAHKEARPKLIVINDSKFKNAPSFINQGPLQAIAEDISKDHVIWYPMSSDGINSRDAIGMTLPPLLNSLKHYKVRPKFEIKDLLSDQPSQASLFFLHDLIYMCGPITHAETILLYKKIFGDGSFDEVKSLRGILHACDFISIKIVDTVPSYMSLSTETFINFSGLSEKMFSGFRRYHMKFNSQRILNG
jgi:hypothetical protein